jgi:hypothetical protein
MSEPVGAILVRRDSREGVMFYSNDMIPDPNTIKDRFELITVYEHPDPRVAELEAVLRECRGVIEEAQTYCEGPQWSPSMAHDCGTAIAKIDEVLK